MKTVLKPRMDTDEHGWERGLGRAGNHPVRETASIGFSRHYQSLRKFVPSAPEPPAPSPPFGTEARVGERRRSDTARTNAIVGHPAPRPSPRSCLTGRGRPTRYLRIRSQHELSQRLIQRFRISLRRENFAVAPAISSPPENCRRRSVPRPGGTPQEISRGQARASWRSPRLPRRTGHAPAGHRRNFSHRPRRSVSATALSLGPVEPPAIGLHSWPFLRCPAGAPNHSARFPGAASATADLPPANLLRRPSGTGNGRPRTDQGKPRARAWCSNLIWSRPRRSVFISPQCSIRLVPTARHGALPTPFAQVNRRIPNLPSPSVSIRG